MKGCEAEFLKAIELDPGSWRAHLYYSSTLRFLGRADQSVAEAKRALERAEGNIANYEPYSRLYSLYDDAPAKSVVNDSATRPRYGGT